MRRTLILLFITIVLIPKVHSQSQKKDSLVQLIRETAPRGITVNEMKTLINSTVDRLTEAGTNMLSENSIIINGATNQVSEMLNQFSLVTKNETSRKIKDLSEDVKSLADQMYSVSTTINKILDEPRNASQSGAQLEMARIQAIINEAGVSSSKSGFKGAGITYFQFDGQMPNIVPENGGRVKILGFNLWKNAEVPPMVAILSEQRNDTILRIVPERSVDNHSFSFTIDKGRLQKYSGRCLQIYVQQREKKRRKKKSLGIYYLPMCVPATFNTKIKIVAHLQYACESKKEETLPFKPYTFINNSCTHRTNVSQTECWDLHGGTILNYVIEGTKPECNTDGTKISILLGSTCITATGYLDAASCAGKGINKVTIDDSHWNAKIAPRISYVTNEVSSSEAESDFVHLAIPTTSICVDLDKKCDGTLSNTYWFEIVRETGTDVKTLYISRKILGSNFRDDFNGMTIEATFNPIPIDGKAQICVKLNKPQGGF